MFNRESVKKYAVNALNSAFSENITQPPNYDGGAEVIVKIKIDQDFMLKTSPHFETEV